MTTSSRSLLLKRSWTQIAEQYEKHLVPRFMPWTHYTMQRFVSQKLPCGPILVPACGPGHELVMLADAFPDGRHIIGIDLAEGMVDLANSRCKEAGISGRAWAEVADACDLDTRFPNAAGVFSLFGLQQLPQPQGALANWVKTLCPGGSLAVAFWPSQVEEEGPWQRLADLSTNKPRAGKASSSQNVIMQSSRAVDGGAVQKVTWEQQVPGEALKQGGVLVADEQPAFAMHWDSIVQFWQVMTQAGPWHARLLQLGEEHMEALRQEFMAAYACVEDRQIEHYPHARLIVIRKQAAAL